MAGYATFREQFWRRLALVEILRDRHRSAQRDYRGKNKQTAARFHWRHQFFRFTEQISRLGRRRTMAGEAQSAVQAWRKMGALLPLLRFNRGSSDPASS